MAVTKCLARSNKREEKNWAHRLRDYIACHNEKVIATEAWSAWSHFIHRQETKKQQDVFWYFILSAFHKSWIPATGSPGTLKVVPSYLIKPL